MIDRRKALRSAVRHLVLIVGCAVFAFPFYWLITTSMKERTEIFVSPPKWIPGTPERVASSPYASSSEYPHLRMPDDKPLPFQAAVMGQVLGKLEEAAQAADPAQVAALAELPGGIDTLRVGLFNETAAGLPRDQWIRPAEEVAGLLAARVTPELAKKAFDNVFRGFEVRGMTVLDMTQRSYRPSGRLTVEAEPPAFVSDLGEGGAEPTRLLHYEFGSTNKAVFTVSADMPTLEGSFAGITVPLTGDKSWHALSVEIDTPEGLFRSREAYSLADALSVEWKWLLPEAESGFRKEKDYTDLVRVGDGTVPPGKMDVRLTLARRGPLAAAMCKFTRAYTDALRYIDFWRYLGNTVAIVCLSILGALLSCSLVAYGFARLTFPGRDVLFAVLLSTMMLPGQVTMVPQFLIYRYLGWYNTLLPLWAPSFLGSAFFIFMLRQFMKSIPKDIEDAAKIDGCGYFGIYWRIMLPLIKPALAAVAIFTFMGAWNNFMGPLIYLNDERLYPLSLGIYQFRMEHSAEYSMMMAASTLMMLPVLTVFFVAQRYFIQGVTLTGVKG